MADNVLRQVLIFLLSLLFLCCLVELLSLISFMKCEFWNRVRFFMIDVFSFELFVRNCIDVEC